MMGIPLQNNFNFVLNSFKGKFADLLNFVNLTNNYEWLTLLQIKTVVKSRKKKRNRKCWNNGRTVECPESLKRLVLFSS